ncbi:MAG TPA: type I 3-dehydroquinate dehydratase, partial [Dissulfurispiraceae bacterium]|nr:type I 3-dehydroquinate dehydratase [Dissulfurispiraceae bacterium]
IFIRDFRLGEFPLIAGILTDRDYQSVDSDIMNAVDVIELRVDMFDRLESGHIKDVFKGVRSRFNKPIIATVRDPREGGEKEVPDRLEIYRGIIPLADLVDVEIQFGELMSGIRKLCDTFKKLLIGSFHDFDSTPQDAELDRIVERGKGCGADIVKIAVKATSREDLLRFLGFAMRNRDSRLITISMGEKGLPSRIFTPLLGSPITFGYINTASAPGQLSVREMMLIFRKLRMR